MNIINGMSKQHKHADLIKAWADGAKIQYFSDNFQDWIDTENPTWIENTKYRIDPENYIKFGSNLTDEEIEDIAANEDSYMESYRAIADAAAKRALLDCGLIDYPKKNPNKKGLSFIDAIKALKQGKCVMRKGCPS